MSKAFDNYVLDDDVLDDDYDETTVRSDFDGRHATLLGDGCRWYNAERKENE